MDHEIVRGPKALKMTFKKKLDHGSVTMEICPLTWDNFMFHDLNNPLIKHINELRPINVNQAIL